MGDESLKQYTWEEIKEHRSSDSLWLVVDGKVYDVTDFLDEVRAPPPLSGLLFQPNSVANDSRDD